MKYTKMISVGIIVLLLLVSGLILLRVGDRLIVQEDGGVTLFGVPVEVYVSIGSSVLAIFLFGISFLAYKREKRSRMLFVMSAFLLFAVKGLMIAADEVLPPVGLIDQSIEPIALMLDFGILLLFFLGLVKE